jgi:hypothetical protein
MYKTIDGKRKRMTSNDKVDYVIQIIQDAGLGDFFSNYRMQYHSNTTIEFTIKPEYRKHFKPGTWYTEN